MSRRHESPDGKNILLIERVVRTRVEYRWLRLFGKDIETPAKAWIKTDAANHFFQGFGIKGVKVCSALTKTR